jgi:hypothetical protein
MNLATFDTHTVGPWRTVPIPHTGLEIEQRAHRLAFLMPPGAEPGDVREPCGRVNAGEFLGVPEGHLLCEGLTFGRAVVSSADDLPGLLAEGRQQLWRVTFRLLEQTPIGWNELYHPSAGGWQRRRHDILDTIDLAGFFGGDDYPATYAATTREE